MTKNEYDLIVIGAGGAGSTAANNAAKMGKRVALIERDTIFLNKQTANLSSEFKQTRFLS